MLLFPFVPSLGKQRMDSPQHSWESVDFRNSRPMILHEVSAVVIPTEKDLYQEFHIQALITL